MSVIALTNDTGTILERYAYDAYGEPVFLSGSGTVISGTARDNRHTSTGQEWDADLALYHFRARIYDPEVGRFLGRDPAGYFDATMLYGYAGNSPEVYYDPFGLERVRSQKDIACELWPDVCAEIDGCVMVGRVPKDNYTPTDNGCTWVPDGFPWIRFPWAGQFLTACNNHDY
jgi:RHS repeat-associated protein